MWFCYILRNLNQKYKNFTYIGSTNNPIRRIRQHNSEIVGGAKYTTARGNEWEYMVLLCGHLSHSNVLSCEWKLKNLKKRYIGPINKIKSLNELLQLEKWTNKCEILNKDCIYKLFIINEMKEYFIDTNIPDNITVEFVDVIDKEFITKIMNDDITQ
jgi:predicted GIY-YIG superfamily endonuclease